MRLAGSVRLAVLGGVLVGAAAPGLAEGAPIRVAVENGPSSTASVADLATQLNDDTYFDFSATVVTADQIDTAVELAAYDVVILSASGHGGEDWTEAMAAALKTWTGSGGGVVTVGWAAYIISGASTLNTDLDAVIPVDADIDYGVYCSSPVTYQIGSTRHPITFGLSSFSVTTSYTEASQYAPDATGGLSLATASATGCTATNPNTVVSGSYGSGYIAYIGLLYGGNSSGYDITALRTGAPDRLLEQAVAWASGYTVGDADGDGDPDVLDCDDTSSSVYRGATETCNGKDDDCDGTIDEGFATSTYYRDADGDGYGTTSSISACSAPSGYATKSGDCNDSNNAIHPGRAEICDGVDQDCDGTADDGLTTYTYYRDADGDGYGAGTASSGCSVPSGYVTSSGDCNDSNDAIYPGRAEICDGVDQDCDGTADDGLTTYTYYRDADGDGYGAGAAATGCSVPSGYSTTSGDCDDTSNAIKPGATEVCNEKDDDCDGKTDEGLTTTYYRDSDGDTYGDPAVTDDACTAPGGYVANSSDCDDTSAAIKPGGTETCNGKDDDCDGDVDEGLGTTWYADDDKDGYGDAADTTIACTAPSGYVANADDCDDTAATIYPGAPEALNGKDDDCDGEVDEGTSGSDDDGDGYTDDAGDCDDADDTIYPGAPEFCDGSDQDCDGTVDDGTECYDDDGDGYDESQGDCDDANASRSPGVAEVLENGVDDDCDGIVDEGGINDPDEDGYSETGGDCDPDDGTVYPGAPELEDGKDNDCDDVIDEGTDAYDDDGDGYTEDEGDCDDADDLVNPEATETADGVDEDCDGIVDDGTTAYDDDGDGYTEDGGDCDDADDLVHPGASEEPNGVDDNCDGTTDEGLEDVDGDGFGAGDGDCDDANDLVYPSAYEICDDLDNDCNGEVDDNTVCEDGGGCGCAVGGSGTIPALILPLIGLALARRRAAWRGSGRSNPYRR